MKVTPINEQVLVEVPKPAEEVTDGGITLPESAKGKSESLEGTVLKVADGVVAVSVGDVVGFSKFAGEPIPDNDRQFLIHVEELQYKKGGETNGREQTASS